MNFSTSLAIVSCSGIAYIHLAKYLMTTSKYLSTLGAFGSGPRMSIPHMEKGQRELRL